MTKKIINSIFWGINFSIVITTISFLPYIFKSIQLFKYFSSIFLYPVTFSLYKLFNFNWSDIANIISSGKILFISFIFYFLLVFISYFIYQMIKNKC